MFKTIKWLVALTGAVMALPAVAKSEISNPMFVLVSFGMPIAALEGYCANANKNNAVLMLRGFINNSLLETQKILSTSSLAKCSWQIEPRLFSKLDIQYVPVGIKFNEPLQAGSFDGKLPHYARIDGNITLDEMAARLTDVNRNSVGDHS